MAIINNNFVKDNNDRSVRLQSIAINIDEFAIELGISTDMLDWAHNAQEKWFKCLNAFKDTQVESKIATKAFRKKILEIRYKYQKAKDLLKAIVKRYDEWHALEESYSIDKRTPLSRAGIESVIDDLIRQHDIYKAAGDPWVLPDRVIEPIRALRIEMDALYGAVSCARKDYHKMVKIRSEHYNADTRKLQLLFATALEAWGPDDLKLHKLGFLYRSAIWTKHVPQIPKNFHFDTETKLLTWNKVKSAFSYGVQYRKLESDGKGDWTQFYNLSENSCALPSGVVGWCEFRVRAIGEKDHGGWASGVAVDVGV